LGVRGTDQDHGIFWSGVGQASVQLGTPGESPTEQTLREATPDIPTEHDRPNFLRFCQVCMLTISSTFYAFSNERE